MPRLTNGLEQVLTNLGIVGSGYKLFFYETGTTTLKTTYSDETLTVANTNPVVLNSAGRPSVDIWGSDPSLYRMILGTPDSVVGNITTVVDIDPVDNYQIDNVSGLTPIPTAYWGTTTGISTAYTLATPLVDILSYSSEQTFFIDFHIACGNNPTLQIKDLPALNLKKYTSDLTTANLQANDILVGRYLCFNNGSYIVVFDSLTPATISKTGTTLLPQPITIANNATDADHDLDFGTGNFQFDDGSGVARLTAMTKRFDATFALGNNAGGMAQGIAMPTNSLVYLFFVSNADNSITDIIGDTSSSGANIVGDSVVIANSLINRGLVGYCQTNSSNNFINLIGLKSNILGNVFKSGTFSTNGYTIIPSGIGNNLIRPLIIQWGVSTGSSTRTGSFPIAFPNSCLRFYTTVMSTAVGAFQTSNGNAISVSQFTIQTGDINGNGQPNNISWLAIGY